MGTKHHESAITWSEAIELIAEMESIELDEAAEMLVEASGDLELSIECDGDDDDDIIDGVLYRSATYRLAIEGEDTQIEWVRTARGSILCGQTPDGLPGDIIIQEDDNSDRAPEWLQDRRDVDASVIPDIDDSEVRDAENEAFEVEHGPDPNEDKNGDWGVVDMDGNIMARFADQDDCEAWIAWREKEFAESPASVGGAYVPRSVVNLTEPYNRCGQYSTSWSN